MNFRLFYISIGFLNFVENKFVPTRILVKCPETDKLPIVYNSVGQMSISGNSYIYDYDVLVKEDIERIGVKISIVRCVSMEKPDTCELFHTFITNDFCTGIRLKSAPWGAYIANCMQPELKCPLKKGIYKGRHCVVSDRIIELIPASNFYLKINASFLDSKTKRILSCSLLEAWC